MRLFLGWCVVIVNLAAKQPLVVVSVDGLDNRYLTNADQMGLKIPNLRRLMREGQVSRGIIGVVPTITWPSHTTMITGVDPVKHGILANWRPPGEKYLDYSQIKVPTLLSLAHAAGLTTATINWPVSVNAPVDWNVPEYFLKRRGGGEDRRSVESKAKPADLFDRIADAYPSFAEEWMYDRNRTQAAMYILQHEKPYLLLIHLADLDAEEHDNAPYTREAKAIVERSDELIGQILSAMPAGSALAVVSDHGFERVNTNVDLAPLAKEQGVWPVVLAHNRPRNPRIPIRIAPIQLIAYRSVSPPTQTPAPGPEPTPESSSPSTSACSCASTRRAPSAAAPHSTARRASPPL